MADKVRRRGLLQRGTCCIAETVARGGQCSLLRLLPAQELLHARHAETNVLQLDLEIIVDVLKMSLRFLPFAWMFITVGPMKKL